jgi:hypothetical protein
MTVALAKVMTVVMEKSDSRARPMDRFDMGNREDSDDKREGIQE